MTQTPCLDCGKTPAPGRVAVVSTGSTLKLRRTWEGILCAPCARVMDAWIAKCDAEDERIDAMAREYYEREDAAHA